MKICSVYILLESFTIEVLKRARLYERTVYLVIYDTLPVKLKCSPSLYFTQKYILLSIYNTHCTYLLAIDITIFVLKKNKCYL